MYHSNFAYTDSNTISPTIATYQILYMNYHIQKDVFDQSELIDLSIRRHARDQNLTYTDIQIRSATMCFPKAIDVDSQQDLWYKYKRMRNKLI